MNELIRLIKTRHSVRAFSEKPIPAEDLRTVAECAICAPSARNMQKWHFTVLSDRARIGALAKVVGAALGRGEDYDFYAPSAFIIASGERDHRFTPVDCACALENIFLAAHALGIGSVWINQLGDCCDDAAVRAMLTALGVPEDHVVVGCAALGYAAGEVRAAEKDPAAVHYAD